MITPTELRLMFCYKIPMSSWYNLHLSLVKHQCSSIFYPISKCLAVNSFVFISTSQFLPVKSSSSARKSPQNNKKFKFPTHRQKSKTFQKQKKNKVPKIPTFLPWFLRFTKIPKFPKFPKKSENHRKSLSFP